MSAFADPVVVVGAESRRLTRIPLYATGIATDSSGLKTFSEAWLQMQLFRHPQMLPLHELAPSLGKVVPICMELNLPGCGSADILYVTTAGQLILVETKLWRNPQARREVVAQVIDYAKELTSWTYEDLAREVARSTQKGSNWLLDSVLAVDPEIDTDHFVDAIQHSLKTGDVLLAIVGDGIRSQTEALVGFLEQYGSLRFSFALIELVAYDLGGDQGTLLLPRVLAKTQLLHRTIVVAVDAAGNNLATTEVASAEQRLTPIADTNADTAALEATRRWFTEFWGECLQDLKLDDQQQPTPRVPPKSTNATFPMPPGASWCWVSAYLAKSLGLVGVFLTWGSAYQQAGEAFAALEADRESIEAVVGVPLTWNKHPNGRYDIAHSIPMPDLDDPLARKETMAYMRKTINGFVNAMRPRLEAFERSKESP